MVTDRWQSQCANGLGQCGSPNALLASPVNPAAAATGIELNLSMLTLTILGNYSPLPSLQRHFVAATSAFKGNSQPTAKNARTTSAPTNPAATAPNAARPFPRKLPQ
jgi:hypothetical protein